MLELACIFTTGGVVLFYKAFCTLTYDPIDVLIKKVLIQDKTAETAYFSDPYVIKWKLANDIGLIFAIVYREMFHLLYIDELLEMMKSEYIANIYPRIVMNGAMYKMIPDFQKEFVLVMQKWETKQQKTEKKNAVMRQFSQTTKGKEFVKNNKDTPEPDQKKKPKADPKSAEKDKNNSQEDEEEDGVAEPEETPNADPTSNDTSKATPEEIADARKKVEARFMRKSTKKDTMKKESPKKEETPKHVLTKQNTNWGVTDRIDSRAQSGLDFSKKDAGDADAMAKVYLGTDAKEEQMIKEKFLEDNAKINLGDSSDSDDDKVAKKPQKAGIFSKFSGSIKNLTGNKVLNVDDLEPVLGKFKEDLMTKNVAEQIALKLCENIKTTLVDKKTKAFTSVSKTVKECLLDSLSKILTPKRNIDLIAEAMRAKEQGKPYVLVFIGVNGVGKSTNLAKVAYLLKNQGFSVMLAACDNFRAGAVEQLKTHGNCLKVPVFDRGYKDDPANIAHDAIREATQKKIDCVLIDTAGRMQDNEPLMKALSRLVVVNQPDLIVFVGEALVGNDAVDQLTKFNKALVDLSPKDNIREIDAILLTKFDTVDDKVGAAISMTYTTGKPVIFCGVGQKYTNLKKLNIPTVVNALLN
jgi:signal recognition particle receptor subunit alpha